MTVLVQVVRQHLDFEKINLDEALYRAGVETMKFGLKIIGHTILMALGTIWFTLWALGATLSTLFN